MVEKTSNKFEVLLKQFAKSFKDGINDGSEKEGGGVARTGKDDAHHRRNEGVRASSRPKQQTKRYMSPGDSLKRPKVLARPRVPTSALTYSPGGKKNSKAKQGPSSRLQTPTRPAKQRGRHRGRVSSTPQSSVGSPSENDENQTMLSPIRQVIPAAQNKVESSYVRSDRPLPASARIGASAINQSNVGFFSNDTSLIPTRNRMLLQQRPPPPRPVKTRRDAEGFLAPASANPVETLADREWRSYQARLDEMLAEPSIKVFVKIAYMKQLEERLLSAVADKRAPPPSVAGSVFDFEPPISHHPNANWYTNAWMQQSSVTNARPEVSSFYQRPAAYMATSMRDATSNSRHMSHFYH